MKTIIKNIAAAMSAIVATLAICFVILAWSEPAQTPPGGNIAAPINTGSIQQTKTGPLGIKLNDLGYWISQVGQSLAFFNSDSSGNPKDAQMVIGQDGNVGIGNQTPEKKLVVGGAAQANQFCLNGECCSAWEECKAFAGGGSEHWVKRADAGSIRVGCVASSADGKKLVAIGEDGSYVSDNYGETWTSAWRANPKIYINYTRDDNGCFITSSDDGSKLAFAIPGYAIYVSTDSGATFTQQLNSGVHNWSAIASSGDSANWRIAVSDYSTTADMANGGLYISGDNGINWVKKLNGAAEGVAVSRDGQKITALFYSIVVPYHYSGNMEVRTSKLDVYISVDGGVIWSSKKIVSEEYNPFPGWMGMVASRGVDADKLAMFVTYSGRLFVSKDEGDNWAQVRINPRGSGGLSGRILASSAKAEKVVGVSSSDSPDLLSSVDGGLSWWGEPFAGGVLTSSLAISADGTRMVAVDNSGNIWTNR